MTFNLLARLRKKMSMESLPDTIEVPPTGENATPVVKAIDDASVDDVALAIQALDKVSSQLIHQVSALRRLHDHARCAGAMGVTNAVEAAARDVEGV